MNTIDENLNPEFQLRSFRGVWIPKEVWFRKDISLQEKCLYVEIESLQDEKKGGCFASNKYFASFFGLSERTIRRSLENLKKLNLIELQSFNGRERILRVVKNDHAVRSPNKPDRPKLSARSGQKCPPSHIYDNKGDNIDSKSHSPNPNSEAEELCSFFISCLKKEVPKVKIPPDLKKWVDVFDKMIRLDKHSVGEIREVILWCTQDPFWKSNILSPQKLREKFVQLSARMANIPTMTRSQSESSSPKAEERRKWSKNNEWTAPGGYAYADEDKYVIYSGGKETDVHYYHKTDPFWEIRGL